MKVTVSRGELLAIMRNAVKVAPTKPTMPVLASVRLRAEDGRLWVEATDLDVTLIDRIAGDVSEPGAVCVGAKMLAQVLGKMPDGRLSLAFEGERLGVSVEGGPRVDAVATGDHDWPELPQVPDCEPMAIDGGSMSRLLGSMRHAVSACESPQVPDCEPMVIDGGSLSRLLGAVRYAVSSDESRPNLNGVFLRATGSVLRAVATDGHRLAQAELAHEAPERDGVILPAKGADRLMDAGAGDVALRFVDNSVCVGLPTGAVLFVRLIDAAFPDYHQVVPKGRGEPVRFDAGALTRTLGVAGVLASERTHGVRLAFDDCGEVEASSDNPDLGKAVDRVAFDGPCPVDGDKPTVIGCNVAYLAQAISATGADVVAVSVTEGLAPLTVRPWAGDGEQAPEVDSLHVIMPMRL